MDRVDGRDALAARHAALVGARRVRRGDRAGCTTPADLQRGFTDSHYLREAFGTVAYGFFPMRAWMPSSPLGSSTRRTSGCRWTISSSASTCFATWRTRFSEAVLELRSTAGAFEQIEEWLREHGFFAPGGEDLIADLFLGYGLSETIRRGGGGAAARACARRCLSPPCPFGMRRPRSDRRGGAEADDRHVEALVDPRRIRAAPSSRCASRSSGATSTRSTSSSISLPRSPATRGRSLPAWHRRSTTTGRPSRAMVGRSCLHRPSCSSPVAGVMCGRCRSRGRDHSTRRTTSRGSEKDAAEHVMIVDLERNDLSRVCEPGSVRWPELMVERPLAGVRHLVSTVEGTLREGSGLRSFSQRPFRAVRSRARRRLRPWI